jgi:hypothetical protein
METKVASRHWLDGWDWKDRLFFGATALITAFSLLVLALRGLPVGDWKPEIWGAIAAWVQAVGSIATIAVGVWTVRYQLRAQRHEAEQRAKNQDRLQQSRSLQMLLTSTMHALLVLGRIKKGLGTASPSWPRIAKHLESLSESLGGLTADEFPSPGLAVLLKGLRVVIVSNVHLAQDVVSQGDSSDRKKAHIAREVGHLNDAFAQIQRSLLQEIGKVATPEERADMQESLRILTQMQI